MSLIEDPAAPPAGHKVLHPLLKLALELGPLAVFYLVFTFAERWGLSTADRRLFPATAIFIVLAIGKGV